jgi:hypothetical protein
LEHDVFYFSWFQHLLLMPFVAFLSAALAFAFFLVFLLLIKRPLKRFNKAMVHLAFRWLRGINSGGMEFEHRIGQNLG